MVVCGKCGGPLTPQRDFKTVADGSTSEYRAYRCQDRKCKQAVGKQVRANGFELDDLVVPAVLAEFARRVSEVGVGQDEDLETVVALEQDIEMAEAELASYLSVAKASMPGFAEGVEQRSADVEVAKAALIEEQGRTRRFPTVEEVEAVLAGSDIEARREAVRRVLLEVVVSAVGTRLRDEFRQADGEALDFTTPAFGPECYEPSSAVADRISTVWT
jgi:hypothetical protein